MKTLHIIVSVLSMLLLASCASSGRTQSYGSRKGYYQQFQQLNVQGPQRRYCGGRCEWNEVARWSEVKIYKQFAILI